jgi:superfamily I DNA/RNA helicase
VILTEKQRRVVDAEGNFLLLACPGSGKTRSAAERVSRLTRDVSTKIAVCSYTNIGAQRIASMLERELGTQLGPEHFIGTIHSFLLRYVVYPFAHLLGAEQGPHIREGGVWPDVVVHGDNRQRMNLDDFRSAPGGSLVITNKPRGVSGNDDAILASVGSQVWRRKFGLFRSAGALTADDAMCVALCILDKHPAVAAAVAGRFDELLLDEAQDTSELQLRCLEALWKTGGLASLVLIGDLQQSIYSFQGASAEGCRGLAEGAGLDVLTLDENHRSSQRICAVAKHFREGAAADTAVGPEAECEIDPEVLLYPAQDPQPAMEVFRGRLQHHGIEPVEAAVLTRRWRLAHALNGQTSIFRDTERRHEVGQIAARLAAGTLTASHVRWIQRLVSYCAWDATHLDELTEERREALRPAAYTFLRDMPPLEGDLQRWIKTTAKALQATAESLTDDVAHTGGRTLQAGPALRDHDAAEVFAPAPRDLAARTIHSFKGEDRDAVMVVIRAHNARDPMSQLELLEAAVGGETIDAEREEERRVVFVALTRARRYCLVALPDDARGRGVAEACTGLGFASIGSA